MKQLFIPIYGLFYFYLSKVRVSYETMVIAFVYQYMFVFFASNIVVELLSK